ncbi:hypothetical protein ABT357_27125 [Streptomyces albidoflavus]|uniref:hypothetical protein n=1 Tax=Streptomyces albidoflavus TaxID=1886 RepID=UPI00333424E3
MGTTTLTARALPGLRADLVQWLRDPGPLGGPSAWAAGLPPEEARPEWLAAGTWADVLPSADLFFASADMTRMAVAAGVALPSYRLHPEDVPAPRGLLVWEVPVTDRFDGDVVGSPVVAVSWAEHEGRVQYRLWCHREDWLTDLAKGNPLSGLPALSRDEVRQRRASNPPELVCLGAGYLPFGRVPGWLSAAPEDTSARSLAEMESLSRAAGRAEQAERALLVTWLLMGQTLVREDRVETPRSAAKRIARIDPALLAATRYVQLRHRSVHAEERGAGEGAGKSYRHRWLVRGHWRNHYYPSRKANRPIWIDQHMKGPDGAPVLDPTKLVSVLRR